MKRPNRQAGKKTPTYEKKNMTREKKSGKKKEEKIGAEKAEGQEALARLNRRGGCVRDTNCTFRDRTGGRGCATYAYALCCIRCGENTETAQRTSGQRNAPWFMSIAEEKTRGKKTNFGAEKAGEQEALARLKMFIFTPFVQTARFRPSAFTRPFRL